MDPMKIHPGQLISLIKWCKPYSNQYIMDPSRIGAGHKREIMHIRTELEIINSSEVGNIAKDATTTIGKWSENLNKALKQWNKDAEQLQQALEDAKSTLKQTAKAKVGNFVQHYQEDKVAYQKLQNCFYLEGFPI